MATAALPRLPWYGARRLCGAHPWFGGQTYRVVRWCGAALWFGVAAPPRDSASYGDRRRTRPVAWSGALRRTPTGHFPRLILKNNWNFLRSSSRAAEKLSHDPHLDLSG